MLLAPIGLVTSCTTVHTFCCCCLLGQQMLSLRSSNHTLFQSLALSRIVLIVQIRLRVTPRYTTVLIKSVFSNFRVVSPQVRHVCYCLGHYPLKEGPTWRPILPFVQHLRFLTAATITKHRLSKKQEYLFAHVWWWLWQQHGSALLTARWVLSQVATLKWTVSPKRLGTTVLSIWSSYSASSLNKFFKAKSPLSDPNTEGVSMNHKQAGNYPYKALLFSHKYLQAFLPEYPCLYKIQHTQHDSQALKVKRKAGKLFVIQTFLYADPTL